MREWIIRSDGNIFCSNTCIEENIITLNKVNMLKDLMELSDDDIYSLVNENNWSIDEAINGIDIFIDSLNRNIAPPIAISQGIKNAGIYNKLANNLSSYNTMRGGRGGFKGFIFEDMHAANATINGKITEVIANNGLADFRILNPDGSYSLAQAKVGYSSSKIDWSPYMGQEIVIDKGNTKLIESARNAGLKVVESDISKADAQRLAKAMQLESKITGKPNAPIMGTTYAYHQAGLNSLKSGATIGCGFSIGSNLVDLACGDITAGEATVAIAKDTAIAAASSYAIGVGTAAIANTAVGGAITAAGTALAGTSVGAATIVTGAAVTATLSGATATVGGAIASTAAGAAVTSGIAATGAVLGTTALGAAAVAAAPVLVGSAVVGGIFKIGKKLCR